MPDFTMRADYRTARLWPSLPVVVHAELIPDRTRSVCVVKCWTASWDKCWWSTSWSHIQRPGLLMMTYNNTRLDYCNSLYFGIADGLMSHLQSVQNVAAHLITPALHQLHWLPVRRRVDLASEVVILELVSAKCFPVLLYGLECCHLNKADLQSLDFTSNRLFMKLFRTGIA